MTTIPPLYDLIFSENGDVVLVCDRTYDVEITRVEFYLESRYLVLVDRDENTRMIEYEINNDLAIQTLSATATILLAVIEQGKIGDGFEVPLITVRP